LLLVVERENHEDYIKNKCTNGNERVHLLNVIPELHDHAPKGLTCSLVLERVRQYDYAETLTCTWDQKGS
jgi:hypothetical protein